MKRTFLLISILLLSAAWAAAQYDDSSNSVSRSKVTVEGCLSIANGSNGRYTLTDPSGAVYRLTGNTNRLRLYVGQTIRVSGISSVMVYTPGAISEGTDTQAEPTLSVDFFKRISGVCHGTSNNP